MFLAQTTTAQSQHTQNRPRPFLLRRATRKAARAFTLIEILVVLAIAGMIIAAAASYLPGILAGAKGDTARLTIDNQLATALMRYNMDMGRYPSTAEGLNALVTKPADNGDFWKGPYAKDILDPWKQSYKYQYPGTHNTNSYDLWSVGADGQDGTADDIGNWAKTENK